MAKGAEVAAMATEAIFQAVSAKRAQGQGASVEKAAETLDARWKQCKGGCGG